MDGRGSEDTDASGASGDDTRGKFKSGDGEELEGLVGKHGGSRGGDWVGVTVGMGGEEGGVTFRFGRGEEETFGRGEVFGAFLIIFFGFGVTVVDSK